MRKSIAKVTGVGLMIFTLLFPLICWAGLFDDILDVVGAVVADQPEKIGKVVQERLQREAAYEALRAILKNANVGGADHFITALKAYVEDDDYGKALAAYLRGLEASDVEDASDVIKVFYAAAITVRLASPEVGRELQSFIDYISDKTSGYRGMSEVEEKGPPIEFSSPERTWETFIAGLREGKWEPVAKALIGYVPEGVDLTLIEKTEEVQELKKSIKKEKKAVAKYKYKIASFEDITTEVKALEINTPTDKGEETFWVVFKKRRDAWKLVGILEDISLLRILK